MKIKNVAVVFQNNIQYESFKNAVNLMIQKNINVDIFIPINNNDDGFTEMFEEFYKNISKSGYNIFRKPTKKTYDILFLTYEIPQFMKLKRKYTIKYMYGLTTKPDISLSLHTNYIFDGFLCYGNEDAKCLDNFGKTFQIGNIKYLYTKFENNNNNNDKKNILYLPTYSNHSSIEIVGQELLKLKDEYIITIKPHHGTEYLKNDIEEKRRKFIKENFKNVYSSKQSLDRLINNADIVITDMSGAVFDAVCLKKPVIMFYNASTCKYGEYISLPVQCATKKHIVSFQNFNEHDLKYYIKKASSKKQIELQNELFKKLYCCENNKTGEKFIEFLNQIESGIIDDNYHKIHTQIKKELTDLYTDNFNLYNNYTNIQRELENLKKENNTLSKNNILLKNNLDNIYNSRSWKITKPLRILKIKIKK